MRDLSEEKDEREQVSASPLSAEEEEELRNIQRDERECRRFYSKLRQEQEKDLKYKLNDSWETEAKKDFEEKLNVPALKWNELGAAIRWLAGYQTMNRNSMSVVGVEGGDIFTASVMADAQKHILNRNYGDYLLSAQFEDAITVGVGWLEAWIDYSEDILEGRIKIDRLLYTEVWVDPQFRRYDLSDARYLLISRKLSKGGIIEMFPSVSLKKIQAAIDTYDDRRELDDSITGDPDNIGQSSVDSTDEENLTGSPDWGKGDPWVDTPLDTLDSQKRKRKEYRVVTRWFWKTDRRYLHITGDDKIKDLPSMPSKKKKKDIEKNGGRIIIQTIKKPYFSIKCGNALLQKPTLSPYYEKYKRWPIVPMFGELNLGAKGSDLKHRGIVRDGRDPQYEINMRGTSLLHSIMTSTNAMIVAPDDTFAHLPDPEQAWADLSDYGSSPNYVLRFNPDAKHQPKRDYPQSVGRELFAWQKENEMRLWRCMSVNPSLMSAEIAGGGQEQSGKALMIRERQGTISAAKYFNHLKWSQQLLGHLIVGLVLDSFSPDKLIRVVGREKFDKELIQKEGENKGYPFANDPDPVKALAQSILDNFEMSHYDIEISEVPDSEIMRFAYNELLASYVKDGVVPAVVAAPYLLEDSPHPKGKEIADKLRELMAQENVPGATEP